MKIRLYIVLISIFLSGAFAQQEKITIDLEKAIQRAMKTNRDLKIARLEKKRANEKYYEALSTALPQINAGVNLTRNVILPFFYLNFPDSTGRPVARKIDVGYNWQYGGNLMLQQPVYTFGRVGAALDIADYYEDATGNDYYATRDKIVENTYLAYNLVHLAKIKLRVVSFSYNVAKKNYELVKHRYDSGLVSEFELLQAKVNMENFAPQVIEAESELERATNNLKVMLTMPLETALVFTDSLRVLDESVAFEEKDIWKRYDYLADQWRLKMYEKNQTIEYSYHLPYIDAALQYKYSGANNEFARNKKLEGETMNVGVTMSIPIFSGFRTQARYEQAVIDYHQATLRLAQKSDRMKMEYKNAKLRLEAARKRLIASKTSRESARKALEIASARKRVGSITELDFQNIQIQLETSERNYYRAIYDFNKAYIDLLKSVGKLDKLFSINDNGESDAQ